MLVAELEAVARRRFDRPGEDERLVVRSPGRVNLIGDHIDYSGGSVLPLALDRGTTAVVLPRPDRVIRGYSVNFPDAGVLSAELTDLSHRPERGWFNYVLGVLATLAEDGHELSHGFDIALHGDIPNGAGLSSSASVELAAAVTANRLGDFALSPTQLALASQRAENTYIGVACGIMDQLAIAEGRAGAALLMNCTSLRVDAVPFPTEECVLVVADTAQQRSLSDSAYNERRGAVERALHIVNEQRTAAGGAALDALAAADGDDLHRCGDQLREAGVMPFARHTISEQARVLDCALALREGDLARVGRLMRESHESLRDDFDVTGQALDALAGAAWRQPGVIGARMTGAGFGGCTVNLLHPEAVRETLPAIAAAYRAETGLAAAFLVVEPAAGAGLLAG